MSGLLPADSGKIASHVFAGSNVALRTQPWSTYGWPVAHLVVVIVVGRAVVAVVTMLGPWPPHPEARCWTPRASLDVAGYGPVGVCQR